MTLADLINIVEEACGRCGVDLVDTLTSYRGRTTADNIQVLGAYQPSYPLTASHVKVTVREEEDEATGEQTKVVWVALSGSSREQPYAPRDVF